MYKTDKERKTNGQKDQTCHITPSLTDQNKNNIQV